MNTTTMDASTQTNAPRHRDHEEGLLARQFRNYAASHHDRNNLVLHAATVPLFGAGTLATSLAIPVAWMGLAVRGLELAVAGALAMIAAVAVQGRGHARETGRPAPFQGFADVIARIFAEQWITFPRFVATGGFARAWTRKAIPGA